MLLLILWSIPSLACSGMFSSDLTGLEFLHKCFVVNPGLMKRSTACERIADGVASQFGIQGFELPVPPVCRSCVEGCALASVLQVAHYLVGNETRSVHECTETFFAFLYAIDLVGHSDSEEAQKLLSLSVVNDLYDRRKNECADLRLEEMESWLTEFRQVNRDMVRAPSVNHTRTAIVIAVGNAGEILPSYQPMINLWRCYAIRHNAELLLDTDDSQILLHYRSANWMRWFTAQKYLAYYESILVVDPDEYVSPPCWDIDLFDILRRRALVTNASVVVREVFLPQTLNDGVVYLRNTPMGHFFLRLLLDKVGWWQTHAQDQGAFDETLLEMAGMEASITYNSTRTLYVGDCFPLVFPLHNRAHAISFYTLTRETSAKA